MLETTSRSLHTAFRREGFASHALIRLEAFSTSLGAAKLCLADRSVDDPGLIDTKFHLCRLHFCTASLRGRHGSGLGIRHQTRAVENLAELPTERIISGVAITAS